MNNLKFLILNCSRLTKPNSFFGSFVISLGMFLYSQLDFNLGTSQNFFNQSFNIE